MQSVVEEKVQGGFELFHTPPTGYEVRRNGFDHDLQHFVTKFVYKLFDSSCQKGMPVIALIREWNSKQRRIICYRMHPEDVKYAEELPVYEDICRLCFCASRTSALFEIEDELMNELSLVSCCHSLPDALFHPPPPPLQSPDDPGMLSQLCESCFHQLMAVLDFRKRINFISTFWTHFYAQRDGSGSSSDIGEAYYDFEGLVQLNCHVCGYNCNFGELQQHILSKHGDHMAECKFCESLISYQSVPILEETVITE